MSFLNLNKYIPLKYISKIYIFQYELRQHLYDNISDPLTLEKSFFEDNTDVVPVSVYQIMKEHIKLNVIEMSSLNMFICMSIVGMGFLYMKDLQSQKSFERLFSEEENIQFMKIVRTVIYIFTVVLMNNVDNAL